MKNKTSLRRPRFWQSKNSGWNLRLHPRGTNNKANSKLSLMTPALGMSSCRFSVARVDDVGPRRVRLQACFNDYYQLKGYRKHVYSGKTRSGTTRNPRLYMSQSSTLKPETMCLYERRADVILHRAGLANSILQARQMIGHGHVYVVHHHDHHHQTQAQLSTLKSAGHLAMEGEIIGVKDSFWNLSQPSGQWSSALAQWKMFNTIAPGIGRTGAIGANASSRSSQRERSIPPYLEVDHIKGFVVLVEKPNVSTRLLPPGLLS